MTVSDVLHFLSVRMNVFRVCKSLLRTIQRAISRTINDSRGVRTLFAARLHNAVSLHLPSVLRSFAVIITDITFTRIRLSCTFLMFVLETTYKHHISHILNVINKQKLRKLPNVFDYMERFILSNYQVVRCLII